jgi:hypothetical protein
MAGSQPNEIAMILITTRPQRVTILRSQNNMKSKNNPMSLDDYLNDSRFNEIHSCRLSWSIVNEEETHLCATASIWGVLFHIDAVEVNESGEALDEHGARHIACLIERNGDLSYDESFVTVELIPGRHYVITFEPG